MEQIKIGSDFKNDEIKCPKCNSFNYHKKGMGMQTTDNGYCTLLWTQTCPHQDLPCKGCGSWVTTLDFLDSHKKELEETERIIENARQKGWQRQIERNVPRAKRLKKLIANMEDHKTMRGIGHNEWEESE